MWYFVWAVAIIIGIIAGIVTFKAAWRDTVAEHGAGVEGSDIAMCFIAAAVVAVFVAMFLPTLLFWEMWLVYIGLGLVSLTMWKISRSLLDKARK